MKITKRLHHNENYKSDVNLFGSVVAKFNIQPFADGYMAYVTFRYKVNSYDENEIQYYGNSLFGLDVVPKSKLIACIEMYTNIHQVFKDFKRNIYESRVFSGVHRQ